MVPRKTSSLRISHEIRFLKLPQLLQGCGLAPSARWPLVPSLSSWVSGISYFFIRILGTLDFSTKLGVNGG